MDIEDDRIRVAVIQAAKCKPKKCRQECKRYCPVEQQGKECVNVDPTSIKAQIVEPNCIGCGQCILKCPFDAIKIVNVARPLMRDIIHRYGDNGFFLSRLPSLRRGKVLGLTGSNGTGKTSLLKLLTGEIQPNLGKPSCTLNEVVTRFRGIELVQDIFTSRLGNSPLKFVVKPQHLDLEGLTLAGPVRDIICRDDPIVDQLELRVLLDREFYQLSGGEKQRVAIAHACSQHADIYVFDEPSCFLDVKQRLQAAQAITAKAEAGSSTVLLVEHDQLLLDYLSDDICLLYGEPGVYGVCSARYNTREGLNALIAGYLRQENVRFRDGPLKFRDTSTADDTELKNNFEYPFIEERLGSFDLTISPGQLSTSEVTVLLGPNGAGKTSWLRLIASRMGLEASVKHQDTAACFGNDPKVWMKQTAREWLSDKIGTMLYDHAFVGMAVKPLEVEKLLDKSLGHLSGGERQRIAIVAVLGVSAPIYMFDEPSANLDIEMRMRLGKLLKKFSRHHKVSVICVDHDVCLAMYMADKIITFQGTPAVSMKASMPMSASLGINVFLKNLNVTFRRDPTTHRPRINKLNSDKDQAQKQKGIFYDV